MFLVNLTSFQNHDGPSLSLSLRQRRLQRPRELQEHDMWIVDTCCLYDYEDNFAKEGFIAQRFHCSMEIPDWTSQLVYCRPRKKRISSGQSGAWKEGGNGSAGRATNAPLI